MFPFLIIILLFILYVIMQAYVVWYFFEKHYITLSINESGFQVMRASIFNNRTKMHIAWSDVLGVYKVEGHDSAGWWHSGVQKKMGTGLYWRLIVKTESENYVFHPSSNEGLNVARLSDKFDLSSRLESEFLKKGIIIEKADIKLIEAILGNKSWYKGK